MRFGAPQFLGLIPLVALLLAAFLFWSWRVKQRLISQFVQSRLLANLTVGVSAARQKVRLALLLAAVTLAMFTLARPQWGYIYQEAKQQGLDIVIAIDASKSMLATDVSPNRLSRAKLAALDLMKQARNDRLALVAFAGTAFLQSPLTLDEEAFRQSVNTVNPDNMPKGGTALALAIEAAQDAFEKGNENHKVLVIFTDGEDHEQDAETLAAAEKAAKAGMKIFTIGIGSSDGEILQIKDDNGNYVKSRLNETLLQKVATIGNGFYLPLRGPNPIETLYSRGLAPLPKSDPSTKLARVYQERYQWFLALAIICMLVEMFLPERKRPKTAAANSAGSVAAKAAALLLLAFTSQASASPSSAMRQYDAGNFELSQKEYERLAEKQTNDYRLHYNAGTAAYQAKQYETAEKHLSRALESQGISTDLRAQERALFNLGNTQVQLGSDKWPSAVTNYVRALKLDPKDTNAAANLAYVRRRLEELKKQQQEQQQKQQKDQNKDQQQEGQQQQQQQQGSKQDQKDQKDQNAQQKQQQKAQQQQQQAQQDKDKDKQQQQAKSKDNKDNKDKTDKKDAAAAKPSDKDDKGDKQEAQAAGEMTRQEANRILDSQEADEKLLIFTPEEQQKKKSEEGPIKDW